ncbi:hypothetical protein WMY93_033556 [Mugilogobius chulae]|uniref:Uncharacterized protein n=1 Tax=Mugilogobius chulae TaxID=88201 RepID=A0AAW0MSK5_9GOBI
MRVNHPEKSHEFDPWHVAKGVSKKLNAEGKKKGCEELGSWITSVINHLWWSAQTCEGDAVLLKEKWISVIHHITNRHDWPGNRHYHQCAHQPLDEETQRSKLWLKPGSEAHNALVKIVMDKRLLKDLEHLTKCVHTTTLEVYHSMYLKYLPKRTHFGYDVMLHGSMLAALDHNHNVNREQVCIHFVAKGQDLSPPVLTVEPSVITERDSVTLHCHTPNPASVSLCFFSATSGLDIYSSSCQMTVRGSDLLESLSLPAEVIVQCYYNTSGKQDNSPYSSPQTVTIQIGPPTTLMMTEAQNILVKPVWWLVVLLAVCGLSVGSVLLSVLRAKRAHGTNTTYNVPQDTDPNTVNAQVPDSCVMPLESDFYSLISSASPIEGMSGFEMVDQEQRQSDDQQERDMNHLYATIPDDSNPESVVYSCI